MVFGEEKELSEGSAMYVLLLSQYCPVYVLLFNSLNAVHQLFLSLYYCQQLTYYQEGLSLSVPFLYDCEYFPKRSFYKPPGRHV